MSPLHASSEAGVIRVMVVDDSAVARGLISRQLNSDSRIDVVCTAPNGAVALSELERRAIDVVVLDIEMPVMDGMTALADMAAKHPGVRVIMASTLTRRNAEISLKALQLGASDYIAKPDGGLVSADDFSRELSAKVRALGVQRARTAPVATPVAPVRATPSFPRPAASRPAILAIGASTGGPPALTQLFQSLRGAVAQPILLTQHMPPTFTALLAEQLAAVGGRPCAEGRDGEPVLPGHCYVAPGGWHMTVAKQDSVVVLRLNQEPPENFCRPAVDPMLRSVAKVYGSAAAVIILTGMGSDGAKGCDAVADAGGRFVVQDQASSVVWGMPGAAAATGKADQILPLNQIGPWARRITGVAA